MVDTVLVNLHGGPGTGKSTTMHGTIWELRRRGLLAEMAPEFAKRVVWEGRTNLLHNQLYLLAKQAKVLVDLDGKVDVIISDAPLLNSILYNQNASDHFRGLVRDLIAQYPRTLNVFLERSKAYEPRGRVQTEDEARALDERIHRLMGTYYGPSSLMEVSSDQQAPTVIANAVVDQLLPGR